MVLVVVESPTKARKIKLFLGKNYTVKASFGHVRDLPEDEFAIDIEKLKQGKFPFTFEIIRERVR